MSPQSSPYPGVQPSPCPCWCSRGTAVCETWPKQKRFLWAEPPKTPPSERGSRAPAPSPIGPVPPCSLGRPRSRAGSSALCPAPLVPSRETPLRHLPLPGASTPAAGKRPASPPARLLRPVLTTREQGSLPITVRHKCEHRRRGQGFLLSVLFWKLVTHETSCILAPKTE